MVVKDIHTFFSLKEQDIYELLRLIESLQIIHEKYIQRV